VLSVARPGQREGEGRLTAAGQDLKRFLAATGWGRRRAPGGSLLALPSPPQRPAAVFS
jgi:hypothetical protein